MKKKVFADVVKDLDMRDNLGSSRWSLNIIISIPLKHYLFIYLFLEREEGREKERERHIDVREKHLSAVSCMHPEQGAGHNPGMCPDWESNQQPLCFVE